MNSLSGVNKCEHVMSPEEKTQQQETHFWHISIIQSNRLPPSTPAVAILLGRSLVWHRGPGAEEAC